MMKRYTDYTKDDLMRLLESLTPGGIEFYESPENCARFIRERGEMNTYQEMNREIVGLLRTNGSSTGLYAAKWIEELERQNTTAPALLAACEETLAIAFKYEVQYWLDAPGTDAEKLAQIVGVMRDAIAAAKGSPQ